MKKKRVLLVHPNIVPSGGGQSVAAWTLQALRETTELSLLTWVPVDYKGVNRLFGTSLQPGDFRVYRTPSLPSRFMDSLPTPTALLKLFLMQRWCRKLDAAERFDVLIGTNNEIDFGRRGIQYVHFPWSYLPRPSVDLRWYHTGGAVAAYRAACQLLSDVSEERIRQNVTLVNSAFIGDKVRQVRGGSSIVLPPPVPGGFPEVPWTDREEAFIGVGRLSPEKRWENAVEIVRRLRDAGRSVRLTLVCTPDNPSYGRQIRMLQQRYADWMTIRSNLPREELVNLVARHRYGLHPMEGEHFGIAVAELQRGGCIPFVHRSGGPMEIVGGEERLMFETVNEAAGKIAAVLDSETIQQELRVRAAERAHAYTAEQFVESVRGIVDKFGV
jgi:glycosyltransferase involved in cell wall biosynthesis